MTERPPFHYAFVVDDLQAARQFYAGLLGCRTGRSSAEWIDFDFYGHQIVAHLGPRPAPLAHNPVDNHDVPVPHFGVVLEWQTWTELAEKLQKSGIEFAIKPCIRFQGQTGEQGTMFIFDPAGNAIEIKAFKHIDNLFAV
jgi:extradiol dioxygenase family protein